MTPSFFTECNCSMSPLGGSVVILAGCWAYLLVVCVSTGVDMCGRTVMVLVGRNIPVTLIAMEKVPGFIWRQHHEHHRFSCTIENTSILLLCEQTLTSPPCVYYFTTGPAVLHPCHGPHHSEGVCDGLLSHSDRRTQPSGL